MNPISTLILFPLQPRRVARAHARTPLSWIYLIHLLGLFVLGAILYCINFVTLLFDLNVYFEPFAEGFFFIGVILIAAIGECIFVVVATIMTCWAGGDEPIGDSWRHALRVSWLYVAHLWWIAVVIGVIYLATKIGHPQPGQVFAGMVLFSATIVWSIISYLRALTTPRERSGEQRTPQCEWCGYNLFQLDVSGNCPECGQSVSTSLIDSIRVPPGSNPACILHHWKSRIFGSLFNPKKTLRALTAHIRTPFLAHQFGFWIAATAFFGGGGIVLTLLALETPPQEPRIEFLTIVVILWMSTGLFTAWCFFMFGSLVATATGFVVARRVGRNLFNAAFQIVALTIPIFPLWAGVGTSLFVVATQNRNVPFLGLYWILANGVVAGVYCSVVFSRIKYLQYANR